VNSLEKNTEKIYGYRKGKAGVKGATISQLTPATGFINYVVPYVLQCNPPQWHPRDRYRGSQANGLLGSAIYSGQCSEFDVRTTFWSVSTRMWHFNHRFGQTVFGFEAVWTDRLTKLGKVSFATWLMDRLDADVAFWKRFGPDKSMVQSGPSLMSVRTWSAIQNTDSGHPVVGNIALACMSQCLATIFASEQPHAKVPIAFSSRGIRFTSSSELLVFSSLRVSSV